MDKGDKAIICDLSTMMQAFDCSQAYIGKLKDDDCIKMQGRGKYNLVESTALYVNRLRNKTEKIDGDGNVIDFHTEKARLTKMQADKAEMEVQELAGELVRVSDVLLEWQNILADVKGKLLSIPSKLATLVADIDNPGEAQELIDTYVREALQELAEYGNQSKRQRDIDPGDERVEAAPETQRKRVGRPRKKT